MCVHDPSIHPGDVGPYSRPSLFPGCRHSKPSSFACDTTRQHQGSFPTIPSGAICHQLWTNAVSVWKHWPCLRVYPNFALCDSVAIMT